MDVTRSAYANMAPATTALLIAIIALAMGVIGIASPASTKVPASVPLGTWMSMPSADTELLGNQSYRGTLLFTSNNGEAGISTSLTVNCVNPSNTAGANLRAQYAYYSITTHKNTSNFVDIGVNNKVLIDNSNNNPCPGIIQTNTNSLPLNTTNPTTFLFRVIGSGGGGSADNPRFSSVTINVYAFVTNVYTVRITSITASTFGATVYSYLVRPTSTAVVFEWMAMNVTGTSCLTLSNCFEHGSSTCTISASSNLCSITTTFPNAFAAAPDVVCTISSPGSILSPLPVGSISLLSAQTLTV